MKEGQERGEKRWEKGGMEGVKIVDLGAELSETHLGSTADLISRDQSHLMKRDHETPVVCKNKSTLNSSQILPLFSYGSKSCSWALPFRGASLNSLDNIQKSKKVCSFCNILSKPFLFVIRQSIKNEKSA